MQKPSLLMNNCGAEGGEKEVHSFPNVVNLQVNIIVRLVFELVYYEFSIQHDSHWVSRIQSMEGITEKYCQNMKETL